ncbi:hypothetical protein DL762_009851 [Monosporascus cannonballus]|uniref:Uncharacterized protein n=1 Tax=Monosporascus cannonballus TaxID=155416 RepID=A0ABY0GVF1_9PEZI|nr:hypothetical protein DL762_009851 [Monosporascus cannonballus]RYO95930.1 hypothetical protein DL763_003478 [Monosporascus cannonballus]
MQYHLRRGKLQDGRRPVATRLCRCVAAELPDSTPSSFSSSTLALTPPPPGPALEVGVAVELIAEAPGVDGLVGGGAGAEAAVELSRDQALHALARADDEAWPRRR